jgi:hypothetical protein
MNILEYSQKLTTILQELNWGYFDKDEAKTRIESLMVNTTEML